MQRTLEISITILKIQLMNMMRNKIYALASFNKSQTYLPNSLVGNRLLLVESHQIAISPFSEGNQVAADPEVRQASHKKKIYIQLD
jgi:hypothetical protein